MLPSVPAPDFFWKCQGKPGAITKLYLASRLTAAGVCDMPDSQDLAEVFNSLEVILQGIEAERVYSVYDLTKFREQFLDDLVESPPMLRLVQHAAGDGELQGCSTLARPDSTTSSSTASSTEALRRAVQ